MPPVAEHFATAPGWEWWILLYFFLGGIAGGSYAIGTLVRIAGAERDQGIARLAFIVSFIALIPCPIFLALDLGQPLRFWHMLVDTSAGGLAFKYWSPMSVGSWALLFFGLFSFVSFLGALAETGTLAAASPIARALRGAAGSIWNIIGTGLGLFVSGYTGVLLAVSNQPVWSDGWPLGGVFLASGLSGSAALLLLLTWMRRDARVAVDGLEAADRNFVILEAALLVLFLATVAVAGTIGKVLGVWLVLWLVVAAGIVASFVGERRLPVLAPLLGLLGVLALRAVVIFSAQA